MNILVVPPSDWVYHPLRNRLHFIFERLARTHRVYVLWFRMNRWGTSPRQTNVTLIRTAKSFGQELQRNGPTAYYLKNCRGIWNALNSVIGELRIDVVVHGNILPSAMVALRRGVPLVYDYAEYYSESASAYYRNPVAKRLVHSGVKLLTDFALSRSDLVITVAHSQAEYVREIVPDRKIEVVPNGVDLDIFRPEERSQARRELGLPERDFLVVYEGSIDEWVDIGILVKAINSLRNEGINATLVLLGGSQTGFYAKRLQNTVREYGLDKEVIFAGFVPYERVPLFINAGDVAVAPYKKIMKNDGTPLKILEYLACNQILLCTRIPELERRFRDHLYFFDRYDELLSLLRSVATSRISRSDVNSRNHILPYSWTTLSQRYADILRSVAS